MKFLLLSDIHAASKNPIARKDDVMKTFFRKFTFVLEYAKKHHCTILQAGDFFDSPRDWYLLFNLMKLLNKYKVPIYSIFGQHDSYLYSNINKTPTTLSILNRVGLVKMLWDKPVELRPGIKIYGSSWKKPIPIPDPNCKLNILIIHSSVYTHPLFPDHKFKQVKKFARENRGYKLILVGDIHRQFIYLGKYNQVVNTGPMLRLDAIEYNSTHKPSAFIYNTRHDVVNKISIPHQHYKEVLDFSHLSKSEYTVEAKTEWIDSIKDIETEPMDIKERILNAIETEPISKRAKHILTEVMEHYGS